MSTQSGTSPIMMAVIVIMVIILGSLVAYSLSDLHQYVAAPVEAPAGGVPGYGAPATPGYGAPAATPGYGAPAATPGYGAPAATPGYGAPVVPGYGR